MKRLFLFVSLICSIASYAQDDSRVENMKRDFLTSELQLTPQESEAFFPIYNEYSQRRKDARKSLRAERKSMMNEQGEGSVDKLIDMEQELMNLQKEYLEKFRKILPEKKIVQLIEAEKKFKMMMMSKLKNQ